MVDQCLPYKVNFMSVSKNSTHTHRLVRQTNNLIDTLKRVGIQFNFSPATRHRRRTRSSGLMVKSASFQVANASSILVWNSNIPVHCAYDYCGLTHDCTAVLRKEMSRTRKVTLRRTRTWGLSQMVMTVGFDPTGESSILSVPATHIVP